LNNQFCTQFFSTPEASSCSWTSNVKDGLEYTRLDGNQRTRKIYKVTGGVEPYWNLAGDPYGIRAMAFRRAVDRLAEVTPNSTVGYIGFAGSVVEQQSPLSLNVPANVQTLKDAVSLRWHTSTRYDIAMAKTATTR
jgi:hypothetical protein